MAKINNPAKQFQFNILIAGVNPFSVQELTMPDYAFNSDEHGDTIYKVKTAGMLDVGTLKISKIINAIGFDRWLWDKIRLMANTLTGSMDIPSNYKELIIVQQMAPNYIVPLQTWTWEGCFPLRINGVDFSRTKSDNTIHTVEFSVDRLLP